MTLQTDNLTFAYQSGADVLTQVSMDFSRAPVIGVVGANGCGKSTLFKALLGLCKPRAGQVLWQGKALDYHKRALLAHRQRVTMVFQEPDQQIFYTDVASDVAFSLKNLGVDNAVIEQRVARALSEVGADSFASEPVQYLSFGQKKRVAIAGALVLGSDYLLLDEPTAGLDPRGCLQMKRLITQIAAANRHVVVSSHDIDLIYEICDFVYVMDQGQVVSNGPVSEVFLDGELLTQCGLVQPWLVKLHTQLGMPLYSSEQALFQHGSSDLTNPALWRSKA